MGGGDGGDDGDGDGGHSALNELSLSFQIKEKAPLYGLLHVESAYYCFKTLRH